MQKFIDCTRSIYLSGESTWTALDKWGAIGLEEVVANLPGHVLFAGFLVANAGYESPDGHLQAKIFTKTRRGGPLILRAYRLEDLPIPIMLMET